MSFNGINRLQDLLKRSDFIEASVDLSKFYDLMNDLTKALNQASQTLSNIDPSTFAKQTDLNNIFVEIQEINNKIKNQENKFDSQNSNDQAKLNEIQEQIDSLISQVNDLHSLINLLSNRFKELPEPAPVDGTLRIDLNNLQERFDGLMNNLADMQSAPSGSGSNSSNSPSENPLLGLQIKDLQKRIEHLEELLENQKTIFEKAIDSVNKDNLALTNNLDNLSTKHFSLQNDVSENDKKTNNKIREILERLEDLTDSQDRLKDPSSPSKTSGAPVSREISSNDKFVDFQPIIDQLKSSFDDKLKNQFEYTTNKLKNQEENFNQKLQDQQKDYDKKIQDLRDEFELFKREYGEPEIIFEGNIPHPNSIEDFGVNKPLTPPVSKATKTKFTISS